MEVNLPFEKGDNDFNVQMYYYLDITFMARGLAFNSFGLSLTNGPVKIHNTSTAKKSSKKKKKAKRLTNK